MEATITEDRRRIPEGTSHRGVDPSAPAPEPAPLRILTLNYEYPPLGGGASPVAQAVARELAARGNRLDVVTMAFPGLPRIEEEPNLRVLRVPCLRKERHICHGHELLTWTISACVRARKLVREERYDLIHAHFFFPGGVVARRLARATGLPWVVTAHGSDVPGYNPDRFRAMHRLLGPVWRRVVRDATAVTSPSRWLAGLIDRRAGWPVGARIIPNGIDAHWIEPAPGRRSILFVSRLLPRKGAQFLLRAVEGLREDWEVHVVGEGPCRGELEAIARSLPRPVTFHGWMDRDSPELHALYRDAAVFVFPSLAENFPVSLLEAMAAGCAIVATDLDSCREVVGDAARFFPPGDVDALRRHLEDLTTDPGAARKLAEAASRRVRERFGWREIGRRYHELFAEVAAGVGVS